MDSLVHIILLLTSTIIYYTAGESIKNNYKLRKDFKLKDVKTAVLPTEVLRKVDNINETKILEQKFSPLIIEFINTVKQNISDSDLILFYNNFNNIKTSVKNFKMSNLILNESVGAQWLPEKNTIELSEDNYKSTIDHELFHVSTTYIDPKSHIIFSGFQQIKSANNQIGEGLNEGYTQYLTEKYFSSHSLLMAYSYEKKIAEAVELIVGQEKMQSLYFNANLKGLIDVLKQYNTEESVYKFITTLDFLNKYLIANYLTSNSNKIILDNLEYINSFLIKSYIQKLILEFPEKRMDVRQLIESVYPILTKIPNVKMKGKKEINTLNEELLANVVNETLSNYELSDDEKTISK